MMTLEFWVQVEIWAGKLNWNFQNIRIISEMNTRESVDTLKAARLLLHENKLRGHYLELPFKKVNKATKL